MTPRPTHLRLLPKNASATPSLPPLVYWRDNFLASKINVADKTRKMYILVIDQFIAFVGQSHWVPTRFDVLAFLNSLKPRVSETTVHTYWRTLRTWFNFIDVLGGFGDCPNPADEIKRLKLAPTKPQKIPKGYSEEHIEDLFVHLLTGCPVTIQATRDVTLLQLLYRSGMRSGEVATLQRKHLDLSNNRIALDSSNTKTNTDRDVYFGSGVVCGLRNWLNILDERNYKSDWVFPAIKRWGKSIILLPDHITPHGIWLMLKRRLREAGVPDNTVHGFRHTFTREAMQAGIPLSSIQRQLGHSSPAMVLHYAQAWRNDQKESFKNWGDN